ncbi:MAG: TRL domain-containing protein [Flavobacteriales bacterium]
MKNILIILSIAIATIFSSCTYVSTYPLLVTDNASSKTGEVSVEVGLLGKKDIDLSISKAAKNGGITKIATVDYRVKTQLFKTTYTTIVTGQ